MKTSILLCCLLPAVQAMAQETHEHLQTAVPTPLKQEVLQLEADLLHSQENLNSSIWQRPGSEGSEMLIAGQDYFRGELFTGERSREMAEGEIAHNFNVEKYSGSDLPAAGGMPENVTCYVIKDQYQIKGNNTVEDNFNYDNTYFLFKDKNGNIIRTVYYIERTVGFLKSEYTFVQQGLGTLKDNTLLVTPNPADANVNLHYEIGKADRYSLRITDMNGKTVMSVLDGKPLEAGSYDQSLPLQLSPGTYMVVLKSKNTTAVTQKLIRR